MVVCQFVTKEKQPTLKDFAAVNMPTSLTLFTVINLKGSLGHSNTLRHSPPTMDLIGQPSARNLVWVVEAGELEEVVRMLEQGAEVDKVGVRRGSVTIHTLFFPFMNGMN